MFFDFQFRSLCGIARIPYAAGGLEQQVVELPPQNYSVAKILKKARLQGPVSGCQNQPKTGYVRRYLQSIARGAPDTAHHSHVQTPPNSGGVLHGPLNVFNTNLKRDGGDHHLKLLQSC